ncbi:MAG: sigma factor [Odoribacter splanchnicus]
MKNSELQDLFVEYYPALKSFAVRYVGAAEVAEDLVQDVFCVCGENESAAGVRDVGLFIPNGAFPGD